MPRTLTIEKTVFAFDELDDRAKERAREWWRSNLDGNDWSCTYDDAAHCAEILGIDLRTRPAKLMGGGTRYEPAIWFSGFCSQGDGACFEGRYEYAKGAAAKRPKPGDAKSIREHAPQDAELHRIADELQVLQRRNFYRLTARMKHSGHYYHSGCMTVDVSESLNGGDVSADTEETLRQLMRDFADWIYRQLEREHDYLNSDEQVDESIRANEYEFTEQGTIA